MRSSPSGWPSRRWSRCPTGLVMLVGQAWLPEGAEVERDAEHDAHAWWPREPAEWPDEADPALRHMADAARP